MLSPLCSQTFRVVAAIRDERSVPRSKWTMVGMLRLGTFGIRTTKALVVLCPEVLPLTLSALTARFSGHCQENEDIAEPDHCTQRRMAASVPLSRIMSSARRA